MSPPAGAGAGGSGLSAAPSGGPDGDPRFLKCSGEVDSPSAKVLPLAKRLLRRTCGGPLAAGKPYFVLLADQYIPPMPMSPPAGAGAGGSGLSAAPSGGPDGDPRFLKCSGEVDSPSAKVLPLAKRLLRRTCGGPLAAGKPYFVLLADQYIPPMPMSPPAGAGAGGSGLSATRDSVVSTMAATLAAFSRAERVTLAGSTMPAAIMSTYSSL